ncbi:phosphotransferase family protein [Streptomyces sp. NPDC032161]|uniref:phosphotransferase family protein n=1 Tax=unclassified Streptomyces TaxID=2593676 RepID=UPI0033D1E64D
MTTVVDIASPAGVDLAALSRWFDKHVPGCQGPLTSTVLHGGRSDLTYRVTDGHSSWVVRRPPLAGGTLTEHALGCEFRVMSALRDRGVAVPEPLVHCSDEEVIGAPFTVVAYVEGRVLRSRADTVGLTPFELLRCSTGLVEQLARLHAVPYLEAGLAGWGKPQGYLRRQLEHWRTQWDVVATRPMPELLRLYEALEDAVPNESGASILHGDFRVDHTILDPADLSRVRAVVDWELATLGDPLADLGTFLAYRHPVVDAFLDSPAATDPGFPSQLDLAEQYALVSGRDITLLPFYQALAYFKIAVMAEGAHARQLQGVGPRKPRSSVGSSVPDLVTAGLALVGRAP